MVRYRHSCGNIAAFLLVLAITINAAPAQEQRPENRQDRREQRQHQPGQFDFYVSGAVVVADRSARPPPSAAARPASNAAPPGPIPSSCTACGRNTSAASRATARCRRRGSTANIMSSMLDLMPAPRLVYQPVGLARHLQRARAQAYFDLVRKAREAVKIPDTYEAPKAPITVDPDEVEEAFVKANPGLSRSGIAVTCGSTRLSEVRICMSKDLKFRDCAEIDRRACRRDKLIMPPVRGGELIRRTGLSDAAASLAIARPAN